MEHKVFSVFDAKAECFGHPFLSTTVGLAERQIMEAMQNPNHAFSKYPGDFELYYLGLFDDEKAEYELDERKISLCKLTKLVQNKSDPTIENVQ